MKRTAYIRANLNWDLLLGFCSLGRIDRSRPQGRLLQGQGKAEEGQIGEEREAFSLMDVKLIAFLPSSCGPQSSLPQFLSEPAMYQAFGKHC